MHNLGPLYTVSVSTYLWYQIIFLFVTWCDFQNPRMQSSSYRHGRKGCWPHTWCHKPHALHQAQQSTQGWACEHIQPNEEMNWQNHSLSKRIHFPKTIKRNIENIKNHRQVFSLNVWMDPKTSGKQSWHLFYSIFKSDLKMSKWKRNTQSIQLFLVGFKWLSVCIPTEPLELDGIRLGNFQLLNGNST